MPGRTRTQTAPPGSVRAHMDAREREQRRRIRRRQVRRRRAVALATLVTVVLAASAPFWPAGGGADRAATAGERDGGRARPLAGGRQEASGEAGRRPPADRPTGTLVRVGGRSAVAGRGSLLRFVVEVEGGLGVDRRAFAHAVETVLFDPRGWRTSGFQFQRVSSGPVDFRVALASPDTTDRLCAPLRTRGRYSCHSNGRAVLRRRRAALPHLPGEPRGRARARPRSRPLPRAGRSGPGDAPADEGRRAVHREPLAAPGGAVGGLRRSSPRPGCRPGSAAPSPTRRPTRRRAGRRRARRPPCRRRDRRWCPASSGRGSSRAPCRRTTR
jgi:hypothetical protein